MTVIILMSTHINHVETLDFRMTNMTLTAYLITSFHVQADYASCLTLSCNSGLND